MDTWPTPPGPFDPLAADAGRSVLTRVGGHLQLAFHPVEETGPLEAAVLRHIERASGIRTLPVPGTQVAQLRAAAGQR